MCINIDTVKFNAIIDLNSINLVFLSGGKRNISDRTSWDNEHKDYYCL
jgi:hypothetical protein